MAKRKKAATTVSSRARKRTRRSGGKKKAKRRAARATAAVRREVKAEQAEVMAEMRGAARARGMRVTAVHLAPSGPLKCPPGHVRIMVRVRDEHGTLIIQPKCVPR
jgi:hypothetical protein